MTFTTDALSASPFSMPLPLGNLWIGLLLFFSELFHAHVCAYRIYKTLSCAFRTVWLLTKASYGEWCFCNLLFSPQKYVLRICLWRHTEMPFILLKRPSFCSFTLYWAISLLTDMQAASGYHTSPQKAHILAHAPLCPHVKVSLGRTQRSRWLDQDHRYFYLKDTLAFYPLPERVFISPYLAIN